MNPVLHARIPLWLKIAYTSFIGVLVPVYLHDYGPTNFLYFCDVTAALTLVALWQESALFASIGAVAIVLPQFAWIVDLGLHLLGRKLTGVTDYMFEAKLPLFTRLLSLYHGWLPFLLLYLLARLGYDRRAFRAWLFIAAPLMVICYFCTPAPGAALSRPLEPVNINYVFGPTDDAPQHWMPPLVWLGLLMGGLTLILWWPAHLWFRHKFSSPVMEMLHHDSHSDMVVSSEQKPARQMTAR